MPGKLFRLTEKIYNTPHLMAPASLENAVRYLQDRNMGLVVEGQDVQLALSGGYKRKPEDVAYNVDTGVGVVSVDGPLTYVEYQGICGEQNASYQQIKEEFDTMLSMGAKVIVFDVDSPGGEAYGCFETAQYIRSRADENDVRLVGYVDGLAASAGYGLVSAMHEVILNPMAEAGSIGVVVQLMNTSKREKSMGIERQYVFAGDAKIPFNEDGEFSESFLADIQDRVDSLYQEFIGHVAEMRGIEKDLVKQTQAKVFSAQKSVELGLADEIMTREEFFEYLSEVVEQGNHMNLKSRLFKMTTIEDESVDMNKLEEMQAELASVSAQFETAQVELTKVLALVEEKETALAAALEQVAKFEAAAAEAAAQAEQLKAEKRKEKLSAVLPAEKAESMFAKLSVLDDESFDEVVTGFAEAKAAVDASDLMSEVGISGEGDAPAQEDAGLSLVAELIAKQKKNK